MRPQSNSIGPNPKVTETLNTILEHAKTASENARVMEFYRLWGEAKEILIDNKAAPASIFQAILTDGAVRKRWRESVDVLGQKPKPAQRKQIVEQLYKVMTAYVDIGIGKDITISFNHVPALDAIDFILEQYYHVRSSGSGSAAGT